MATRARPHFTPTEDPGRKHHAQRARHQTFYRVDPIPICAQDWTGLDWTGVAHGLCGEQNRPHATLALHGINKDDRTIARRTKH